MENMEQQTELVQGTNTGRKQKPSATYTLTQMGTMLTKLKELGLISEKDEKTMEEIRGRVKAEYIKQL